jgi:molybdenum cofactor synthesis domain-containing protein
MSIAILTIGDELLSGDTVNTNATWICAQLTSCGASAGRILVVPDIIDEIVSSIHECQLKYEAIIITGGLGPTHDDITLEGVSKAVDQPLEPHEEVISWLKKHPRYKDRKLSPGTADLPRGSVMIPNTVGVAPGAIVTTSNNILLYILPGVPSEMKAMFEQISPNFSGPIKTRVFVFTPTGESRLVKHFEYLLANFDVTIGSYPQKGGVKIRIEGIDPIHVKQAVSWLKDQVPLSE